MENHDVLAARFRAALEMHDFGVRIMRQNLRRRMPGASEPEIDEALQNWLTSRPISGHDGPDLRVITWEEFVNR